ncbi:MAG: ferredoxin--NADP reductase [Alphaproteobacteria bacterium]
MPEYNAELVGRTDVTPQLAILQVKPDAGVPEFAPGQYMVLGLRSDAPRLPECPPAEETPSSPVSGKLLQRAYSISSGSRQRDFLEFYVSLVTNGELTPRLFALRPGDRLFVGARAKGLFTLDAVPGAANVLMVATGTGLAPYISMLRTSILEDNGRKVAVLHGASYSWDLGYRGELEALSRARANFTYLPVISRPESDKDWRGRTGRLPTWLETPDLAQACGFPLEASATHVFLCGNPGMIQQAEAILTARGFSPDERGTTGTLHREKYW